MANFIKALTAIMVVGAIFAGPASATDDLTIVSASASSDASFSVKYNHIGTFVMHTKGLKKKANGRPKCFWRSGTWTNSVRTPSIQAYRETSRAKFCWLKRPVTVNGVTYTAVKVAGGKTNKPCWNFAVPPGQPQPKPQLKGPVLDVRSLSNVSFFVKAKADARASVTAQKQCPGGVLTGSASGSADVDNRVKVKLSQELLLKSRGRVNGAVRADIRQQIKTMIEGDAKANAKANIVIKCASAPPTKPPEQPKPPITITVKAVTTHDIEGGNTIDLCATIARSDGSPVDPKDITWSPDEGQMLEGTKHKAPSGNWCQGWKSNPTTIDHDVRWTVFYGGKQDSNVVRVLASDW